MKSKITAPVLILILLCMLASMYFPSAVTPQVTKLTWLTHWINPYELYYWRNVTAEYKKLTNVEVEMIAVEFKDIHEEINKRFLEGKDTDIIHMRALWIPEFANWISPVIAIPPSDVQADVKANWMPSTWAGSSWKNITWGYPTEFGSWALVYNRKVFQDKIGELSGDNQTFLNNTLNKLEADDPLTWDLTETSEFTRAADLLTVWNETDFIWISGFVPFLEGMSEEQCHQFLSMLWSNGGEYLNLTTPEPLFNGTEGVEVMQLYYNLGWVYKVYNPIHICYWMLPYCYPIWDLMDNRVAMMILPPWMNYIRGHMGENFQKNLGVAPIPVGPSGSQSVSLVYNWLNVVTQRAVNEESGARAEAAWHFLNWINTPRPAGSILLPNAPDIGPLPRGHMCSLMGDFLIFDSILPSRLTDQNNGRTYDGKKPNQNGTLLSEDFWLKGFIDMGKNYGKPDVAFLKATEVQYEIGTMFENVVTTGMDAGTAVQDAAARISRILPIAGDVNINGVVDIYDAVILIADWFATPTYKWNRGRSDCNDDNYAGLSDALIIVDNYEKTWTP